MGLWYEGAGQQTRVLWQAQQADADGVAHGRQEDWMTKRCSVVVYLLGLFVRDCHRWCRTFTATGVGARVPG